MKLAPSLIKKLLQDEYNFGTFITDSVERAKVLEINISEIDTLQDVLVKFRNDVLEYHIRHEEEKAKQLEVKKEAIKEMLENSGLGLSFAELTEMLLAEKNDNKTKNNHVAKGRNLNNSKRAKVVQYSISFKGKTYKSSGKILPSSLLTNPEYNSLLKSHPEFTNTDIFLREHSADFRNQFPLNAQFKNQQFYVNLRGRLNVEARYYYQLWLKAGKSGSESDFKLEVLKD